MHLAIAFRAIINSVLHPERIKEAQSTTAIAVFAMAVLLITAAETGVAFLETQDARISAENTQLIKPLQKTMSKGNTDVLNSNHQLTIVIGSSVLKSLFSIIVLSALALGACRFLTDETYTQQMAMTSVSAAAGIDVVRLLIETPMHMAFHTVRAGFHLGLMVDPTSHPLMFSWLQRFDIFTIWYYLAFAIGMTTWAGLDKRYGIIVGSVLFVIVQTLFGLLTYFAWVTSLVV